MVEAAIDWAVATMTLAPPKFSFPSTATTIVKMEVDHRWIGVEGLEFGMVKTKMVLELEVVETRDIKKLKRWWWVLVMIEGKLVVLNGDSGRHLPRAAIAWWLYFNSLFFQWKDPKNEENDKWRWEIEKMSQETYSNFDRCWHGGLDATVEEKSESAKAATALHQSTAAATTVVKPNFLQCTSTYFFDW